MTDARKEMLELAKYIEHEQSCGVDIKLGDHEAEIVVSLLRSSASAALPDREGIARCLVNNDRNYSIYHMPGDAAREVEYQSGWIGLTHSLSEDEAERVRVRADAIIALLSAPRGGE